MEPTKPQSAATAVPAEETLPGRQREAGGLTGLVLFWLCVAYTGFHLITLNVIPLETWTYRILHIAGALVIGFSLTAGADFRPDGVAMPAWRRWLERLTAGVGLAAGVWSLGTLAHALWSAQTGAGPTSLSYLPQSLYVATAAALAGAWLMPSRAHKLFWADVLLAALAIAVAGYLLLNLQQWRFRAGVFATEADLAVAVVGLLLILELTRRVTGLALVIISGLFVAYAFLGPWLPGFLYHSGYSAGRFFTYIYTDNGILGTTTAVSSTYIILFLAFAAFLNATRVGEYFFNFSFAVAGRARGGPAKVAVFASGLMGTINGTSAGNVVATGSLTIPLMKRVGYHPRTAAAVEAVASTGGQIMPPIMGAGAFIMAELTGIPYTELVIAAIIPALLYFLSVYLMVDLEAAKTGLTGMRGDDLPSLRAMLWQAYLFLPVALLIGALFLGYSVIRAGSVALASTILVSWFTTHPMGLRRALGALATAAKLALQMVAVCACAGIIVGVIALTGVGGRFSAMLLNVAEQSQVLALFFAMAIAILLGMGMPTTAAYAVAASVVAPGLILLGIDPLIAHFFVFYFAVVSAITPPVALAAYAGAGIAGSDPFQTAGTSFKLGIAAFVVPFMFFYNPALLMQGSAVEILVVVITASVGIYFLSAAAQAWFLGALSAVPRLAVLAAGLLMIEGAWLTDLVGVALAGAAALWQRRGAVQARRQQAVEGSLAD